MHAKLKGQATPWYRLMADFVLDDSHAIDKAVASGDLSLPADSSPALFRDAELQKDVLRLHLSQAPTVDDGVAILRDLAGCGAVTNSLPHAFAERPSNNGQFQADPTQPLETKKVLAEMLGWDGLTIGVPAFSNTGEHAICITSPRDQRLIEAAIPRWDTDWQAYGELILEHHIHVSPGSSCVTAGAVTSSGSLVSQTHNYSDHPDKPTTLFFAAMATCIAKLEADLEMRPSAASKMLGPG